MKNTQKKPKTHTDLFIETATSIDMEIKFQKFLKEPKNKVGQALPPVNKIKK